MHWLSCPALQSCQLVFFCLVLLYLHNVWLFVQPLDSLFTASFFAKQQFPVIPPWSNFMEIICLEMRTASGGWGLHAHGAEQGLLACLYPQWVGLLWLDVKKSIFLKSMQGDTWKNSFSLIEPWKKHSLCSYPLGLKRCPLSKLGTVLYCTVEEFYFLRNTSRQPVVFFPLWIQNSDSSLIKWLWDIKVQLCDVCKQLEPPMYLPLRSLWGSGM